MKKILLFTFFILLNGYAEQLFLLPENKSDARYFMAESIKDSNKSLKIVSNNIESYEITKAIEKLSLKEIPITLISTCTDEFSLHVALFKNVELLCSKASEMKLNFMIFDEKCMVSSSDDFFSDSLHVISSTCRVSEYLELFKLLKSRSRPYLK